MGMQYLDQHVIAPLSIMHLNLWCSPLLVKSRPSLSAYIPYFFGHKTEFFFSTQNNPKNLDPSYKMALDLRDCLGRVNLCYSKTSLD